MFILVDEVLLFLIDYMRHVMVYVDVSIEVDRVTYSRLSCPCVLYECYSICHTMIMCVLICRL